MFFSAIAATSLAGTGWLALALVASEPISSLLQPARSTPADSAADVMSARTNEPRINAKLHTQRANLAPQPRETTLKPLNKSLSLKALPSQAEGACATHAPTGMVNRI